MLTRKEQCSAELVGEVHECVQLANEELQNILASLEEKTVVAMEKDNEVEFETMELLCMRSTN